MYRWAGEGEIEVISIESAEKTSGYGDFAGVTRS
jgi:hypothetical protein